MIHYVKLTGSNTWPFDTEEKAAISLENAFNAFCDFATEAGSIIVADNGPYAIGWQSSKIPTQNLIITAKSGYIPVMAGLWLSGTTYPKDLTIEKLYFNKKSSWGHEGVFLMIYPSNASNGRIIIRENVFDNSLNPNVGYGCYLCRCSNALIEKNLLFGDFNNCMPLDGQNISLVSFIVNRNTVILNSGGTRTGIYCARAYGYVVSNNIISAESPTGTLNGLMFDSATVFSKYNTFYQIGNEYSGGSGGGIFDKTGDDIDVNPLFVNPSLRDYRLQAGSPCIGTGEGGVDRGALGIDKVATPSIIPATGTYEEIVNVSMTCATSGAAIYYTLDGTDPDETDILYMGPFDLSSTRTVKAIGIKAGLPDSDIVTNVFTITYHAPEPGLTWIPIEPKRSETVHFTPNIVDPYSRFLSVDYEIEGVLEFTGKAIDFEFDWAFTSYEAIKTVTQIINWDDTPSS